MNTFRPKINENIDIHATQSAILLRNTRTNQTFHIGQLELSLLQSFNGERTIEELKEINKKLIDGRNLEKFIILTRQSGLLQPEERERRRFNILEIKFSLFNPMHILKHKVPLTILRYLIFAGAFVSSFFIINILINNGTAILQTLQSNQFLRFENILYYLISISVIGFLHEFGHAITIASVGGNVFEMGLMLTYLQPAFYVDITGVNLLRKRGDRIQVWIAGICVQLILAAPTLWLAFDKASSLYACDFLLIFNIINIGMILFNVLFVMKLDGYYILCELLDIKNIREESIAYIRSIFSGTPSQTISPMQKTIYFVMALISVLSLPAIGMSIASVTATTAFPQHRHKIGILMAVILVCVILLPLFRPILRKIRRTHHE